MGRIIISCDSTADLSDEILTKRGIFVNRSSITLDGHTRTDGVDLFPDDLFEYTARTGLLAKTSASNTEDFIKYFKSITSDGDEVIHFTISASMSGTYNFARIAAEEVPGVHIVDSANLSTGIGLLVLEAADMADEGMSVKDILDRLEALKPCVDTSFVIDTLDYLHKGGRCSTVAMLGANVLKLKPCIEVTGGAMAVGKKYRGKIEDVIKTYVKEHLDANSDVYDKRVFVTSTCGADSPISLEVAKAVSESGKFKEVLRTTAGCTVSAHCGPNTLGILFIRKTEKV